MSKEYEYRLKDGEYVLHDGDEQIMPGLQEVSIAFDSENGTLHKHGDPEIVGAWLSNTKKVLVAGGAQSMADELISITGRFPLEELNKCLSINGYIGRMYKKLQDGNLLPELENSEKESVMRDR